MEHRVAGASWRRRLGAWRTAKPCLTVDPVALGDEPRIGLIGPASVGAPGFTASPVLNGSLVAGQGFTRELLRTTAAVDYFKDVLDEPPDPFLEEFLRSLDCEAETRGRLEFLDLASPALGREMSGRRYLVLHSPGGPFIRPMLGLRAGFLDPSVPITGSLHAVGVPWILDELVNLLLLQTRTWDAFISPGRSAARLLGGLMDQTADYLGERGMAGRRFPGQIHVIPWGVDINRFRPQAQAPARNGLGLPPGLPLVLSLGRFSRMYKMDLEPLLLAALRLVRDESVPPFGLVLAGDDTQGYAMQVRQRAAELGLARRVWIRPNVPASDVPNLMAASDVFVSIADNAQESFGLSVAEAAATGLPCVVSDWSGHRDIVADGRTGFHVPTYWLQDADELDAAALWMPWMKHQYLGAQSCVVDVGALAARLRDLLAAQPLRKQMGLMARQRAMSEYSWPRVLEQYQALWEELACQGRAATRLDGLPERPAPHLRHVRRQHFACFPTAWLDPELSVGLTGFGRDVMAGRLQAAPSAAVAGTLSRRLLLKTLSRCRALAAFGQRATVAEMADLIRRSSGCSDEAAMRAVAWLLKTDLLFVAASRVPAAETPPPAGAEDGAPAAKPSLAQGRIA